MAMESVSSPPVSRAGRVPPHSEEAERGVLGSILLDSARVMDICIERQISPEAFYVPAHRIVYEVMLDLAKLAAAIDILTVTEKLRTAGGLDSIGGTVFLDRLIDSTPTAAHAEYYAEIVRRKLQNARAPQRTSDTYPLIRPLSCYLAFSVSSLALIFSIIFFVISGSFSI